ncbi:hypothetical protein VZ95_18620 [Elstera litoralis]|uniref:O-methyltransferase dimerisation domain-containing protein n=1 Tax=Elstera litoralis TaxID=552518 RepID=A0A0F3INW2_9PROT|nr:hypothetical protein [Elstera litoralis]KJV08307.1 hypothetical protein VZ95_18620 [Elstera litoralis]
MTETRIVENLVTQAYGAFALLAGMELDLFSPLADGPLSAPDLADALGGVDPVRLHRLCRALAGYGLLTAEAGGRFALTNETAKTLVKGLPAYRAPPPRPMPKVGAPALKPRPPSAPTPPPPRSISPMATRRAPSPCCAVLLPRQLLAGKRC